MTRGGARPGAGRPALGASPTRQIPALAPEADIERWQAQAEAAGMSFAAWVRQALDAARPRCDCAFGGPCRRCG